MRSLGQPLHVLNLDLNGHQSLEDVWTYGSQKLVFCAYHLKTYTAFRRGSFCDAMVLLIHGHVPCGTVWSFVKTVIRKR